MQSSTAKHTLSARIDKFGVAQPNIQVLPGSGRILIGLPGVSDKERVRKLLQGSANLEFWQTYPNEKIYPYWFPQMPTFGKCFTR